VRPGGPRVVIGGHSPAAFRRAVARGHGWFGNGDGPEDLVRHLAGLAKAATEVERPAWLGRLEISFLQLAPVDADTSRRYADLGVDQLVVYPLPLENPADVAAYLERHAGLPH
jgi:alkanesulfonate monooxygenase SsuD/methylene tetrahydromethanopterin reductase-like flavin-dependent oxidoreductase (luciferase family)